MVEREIKLGSLRIEKNNLTINFQTAIWNEHWNFLIGTRLLRTAVKHQFAKDEI